LSKDLAIVIPAFKKQFFMKALNSIACQTSKNFTLYIGDDDSKDDLYSIVKVFEKEIEIVYKKFDFNLGSISLTKQWERCIKLSKEEKYIWLFSDDDIAPPEAVQRFYETISSKSDGYDLYRFNICYIDQHGNYKGEISNHPYFETSEDFIKRRLQFQTLSSACEYIFSRKVFDRYGFIDFPLAWCADDATWAIFGKEHGIITITTQPVQFRLSGFNISTDSTLNNIKFNSVLLFLKWCRNNFHLCDKKLITIHLAGQTRMLQISLLKRISYSIRFINLVGVYYATALIIKKAMFYRLIKLYE
jgi:glycosyltransferase involved in cell wall biosynthesis